MAHLGGRIDTIPKNTSLLSKRPELGEILCYVDAEHDSESGQCDVYEGLLNVTS